MSGNSWVRGRFRWRNIARYFGGRLRGGLYGLEVVGKEVIICPAPKLVFHAVGMVSMIVFRKLENANTVRYLVDDENTAVNEGVVDYAGANTGINVGLEDCESSGWQMLRHG